LTRFWKGTFADFGGCQQVLFRYQQCFWTILCTF